MDTVVAVRREGRKEEGDLKDGVKWIDGMDEVRGMDRDRVGWWVGGLRDNGLAWWVGGWVL